jgi:hypothetical protein
MCNTQTSDAGERTQIIIEKNESSLSAEEIRARVAEFDWLYAEIGTPEEASYIVGEDGRLLQTASIYAPIVIRISR